MCVLRRLSKVLAGVHSHQHPVDGALALARASMQNHSRGCGHLMPREHGRETPTQGHWAAALLRHWAGGVAKRAN
eukprot:COSAG02_NODE_8821_length_2432_cov_2.569653_2_plen_75_part_00